MAYPAENTAEVTFLFTDIENSASLWESFPEEMHAAIRRHNEVLCEVVQSGGGTVFKLVGDAVYATFADTLDAFSVALKIQAALDADVSPLPC